jgi:HAD superfamily hydrolase (TIGR01549 family)
VEESKYLPIAQESERRFRIVLIKDLLLRLGAGGIKDEAAEYIQDKFDADRISAFDFFPGMASLLRELASRVVQIVITNGPAFSQLPKLERVSLSSLVDHVIVGGMEPEQKPAKSIFQKALALAECAPSEAIHVGDSVSADITGAKRCGITSIWVQHGQTMPTQSHEQPSFTVASPVELPELINGLLVHP